MWIPNQEGTNCVSNEETLLQALLETALVWGQRDWDSNFRFF